MNLIESGERKMINIVIGIIFVVGGLSGKLVLIGTDSNVAIIVLGVGLLIYGGVQKFGGNRQGDKAIYDALEEDSGVPKSSTPFSYD